MSWLKCTFMVFTLLLVSLQIHAQEWRTQSMSSIDRLYIKNQVAAVEDLASRNFGRHLNGDKNNDIAIMQRLLDEQIVGAEDVGQLQAMGIVLGLLLKAERGLSWIIYIDKLGRSRSLQVPGFNNEFIFPVTQISRLAEVGIRVDIAKVYEKLQKTIADIHNKPPF